MCTFVMRNMRNSQIGGVIYTNMIIMKSKILLIKLLILIGMMGGGVSSAWGEDVLYKKLTFPSGEEDAKTVNGYSLKWHASIDGFRWLIENFNCYLSTWSYVKCGDKSKKRTASIATLTRIQVPVSKIEIQVDAIKPSYISDMKLEIAQDSEYKTILKTIPITKPTGKGTVVCQIDDLVANAFYRLSIVTPALTNENSGTAMTISGVYYYTPSVVANLPISQYGYTTYTNPKAYIMPEGLKGLTMTYKGESDNGYELNINEAYKEGNVVPANESLLIEGSEGTYTLYEGSTTASPKVKDNENCLRGEFTEQEGKYLIDLGDNTNNYCYFKLTTKNNANFGWYVGANDGAPFTMSSNERAYLALPKPVVESGVKSFALEDMDVETGVRSIILTEPLHDVAVSRQDARVFDLSGRVIGEDTSSLPAGIYVRNGKKFIVK